MIQTSGQFKNKIVLDQISKAIFLWKFFIYIKKDIKLYQKQFKKAKNWKWSEWVEEGEGMSNLNLKGVWIPIEILTDNKLSDKEKYIYAIILLR